MVLTVSSSLHYESLHSLSCLLKKSRGTSRSCVDFQGVLVVMLSFMVLELLAAACASAFWWKRSTLALHSSGHE